LAGNIMRKEGKKGRERLNNLLKCGIILLKRAEKDNYGIKRLEIPFIKPISKN
jgi:hypothetical protein